MECRNYPRLAECIYWDTLPNGLRLAVVPKKGFSRKMAYFVTGAGSMHRTFTRDGKNWEAPMGVAHFLEHKLFDMPGGRDITEEFASLGASVNAFTSYDMTAYYFSCTEHFSQCLSLLTDLVTQPHFTHESVDKEQGIIGQEIDMNEDAPETRIFENLMEAMYECHPIREPILGTRQTISQITPQVLYDCHRAMYSPDHMIVCVVGDVDPQEIRDLVQQKTKDMLPAEEKMLRSWAEPERVLQPLVQTKMEVSRPVFQIGFKCAPLGVGEEAIYQEFVGDLAAEVLFGESSELYLRLYEEGLIDPSFGGGLDTVCSMTLLTATGDSDDPEAVRDAILERARQVVSNGIPEEDFLRIKRSTLGGKIRSLDSFDSVCFRLCAYHFSEFDYFDFPAVYESVRAADVQKFIADFVTEARCSLSIILPKED